jgi:hypothetical protein
VLIMALGVSDSAHAGLVVPEQSGGMELPCCEDKREGCDATEGGARGGEPRLERPSPGAGEDARAKGAEVHPQTVRARERDEVDGGNVWGANDDEEE